MDSGSRPKLVGHFIRQRRETLGISQRALGQLFNPPVTTQFISNLERGVTPLPPSHVPTLTRALAVAEAELMSLLEKEYALKLSGRLGRANGPADAGSRNSSEPILQVSTQDFVFVKALYDAWQTADKKTQQAFATVCESILKLPKNAMPSSSEGGGDSPG